MKKIYLLVSLVIILASCDKREVELKVDPILTSESGIVGIIHDGGNTSCDELEGSFVTSTGKIDFVNGSFVFEQGTGWPFGLEVTVSEDGRYISFTLPASSQYCVGAVIAKGGNASNVFTYSPGVKSDEGLSSPVNSSGSPAQLSNLTFCFVECPEERIIAVKCYYYEGSITGPGKWAASIGTYVFSTGTGQWCDFTGINPYVNSTINMHISTQLSNIIGIAEITTGINPTIKISLSGENYIYRTFVFVGTQEELTSMPKASDCPECPDYNVSGFWKIDNVTTPSNTVTINL